MRCGEEWRWWGWGCSQSRCFPPRQLFGILKVHRTERQTEVVETGANLRVAMDKWRNERRKSRFIHDIPWNQSGLKSWTPRWTRLTVAVAPCWDLKIERLHQKATQTRHVPWGFQIFQALFWKGTHRLRLETPNGKESWKHRLQKQMKPNNEADKSLALIPAEAFCGALTSTRVSSPPWARGFSSCRRSARLDALTWWELYHYSLWPAECEAQSASCSHHHTWQLHQCPRSFRLIPQHLGPPEIRRYPAGFCLSIIIDRQAPHFTLTSSRQVGSFAFRKRRRTVAGFVVKQAFMICFYSQSRQNVWWELTSDFPPHSDVNSLR